MTSASLLIDDRAAAPARNRALTDQIKADILTGALAPGARLRLEDLRSRFGVSWSPLRESLSRLVAEGFIVMQGARTYCVAPISRVELVHLIEIRVLVEQRALRASIEHGDDEWESTLVSLHHHLSKLESARWNPDAQEEWETLHRRFHQALIAACGSQVLLQYSDNLYNQSDRYRRLFFSVNPRDRDVDQEHQAIFDAAIQRNAEEACRLLELHVRRTLQVILTAMDKAR